MNQLSHIVRASLQNPHASMPLVFDVPVVLTASEEQIAENVRVNSRKDQSWLSASAPHDGVAVICGGGPSLQDSIADIELLVNSRDADVFAANAAATFLVDRDICGVSQVIIDPRNETAGLIEERAAHWFFASQVSPLCLADGGEETIFHLGGEEIETLLPPDRVKAGNYVILGGSTAGLAAAACAYAMGYREFHFFGFDSSNRDDATHAYEQPLNAGILNIQVDWAGRFYSASVAMKKQAEDFMKLAASLVNDGCKITVHGDGLLPAMWNTPITDLSERDKYRLMWNVDAYRAYSPGERVVDLFLDVVKPGNRIVDFGCGSGKASIELAKRGYNPVLVDFADNCRDREALGLQFMVADLTKPIHVKAPHGFCADVMEHIPPKDVETVIRNIMEAAPSVFFQISTVPDGFGTVVGTPLHLSIHDHGWWHGEFTRLGYEIAWQRAEEAASLFHVKRSENGDT